MGLMNALAMDIKTMKYLFVDILNKEIVVSLDYILIYRITLEEHLKLLRKAFICLCQYTFYCKLKKCSFFQKTTTFLGFDITPESICISDT